MKTKLYIAASLAGLLLAGCAGVDVGDRVFIVGDTAYIDGHAVPKSEYEKAEANGTLDQLAKQLDEKGRIAATPSPAQAAAQVASTVAGPHAAICDTVNVYDTYPGDSALFSCTAGLGSRTRAQLLADGWKIDLMEKVPAGDGQTSPRGLPLYAYKLVLSR